MYRDSTSFPYHMREVRLPLFRSSKKFSYHESTYSISVSSSGKTSVSLPFIPTPGVLANTSLPSKVVSSKAPSKLFIALERGVLFALLEGDKFALTARSGCLLLALRPCVLVRVGLPAVLIRGCVGGAIDATDLRERALLGLGAIWLSLVALCWVAVAFAAPRMSMKGTEDSVLSKKSDWFAAERVLLRLAD
jgi:hypothetical protein